MSLDLARAYPRSVTRTAQRTCSARRSMARAVPSTGARSEELLQQIN